MGNWENLRSWLVAYKVGVNASTFRHETRQGKVRQDMTGKRGPDIGSSSREAYSLPSHTALAERLKGGGAGLCDEGESFISPITASSTRNENRERVSVSPLGG